jgi:hypothetical protein
MAIDSEEKKTMEGADTSPSRGERKTSSRKRPVESIHIKYWILILFDLLFLFLISIFYPPVFSLVLGQAKIILGIVVAIGAYLGICDVGFKMKHPFRDTKNFLGNYYAQAVIIFATASLISLLLTLILFPDILRPTLYITAICPGEFGRGNYRIIVTHSLADSQPVTIGPKRLDFNKELRSHDCQVGDHFEVIYVPQDVNKFDSNSQKGLVELGGIPVELEIRKKSYRVPIEILPRFDSLRIDNVYRSTRNENGRVAPTLLAGGYTISVTSRGFMPLRDTLSVPDSVAFHRVLNPIIVRAFIVANRDPNRNRVKLIPGDVTVRDPLIGSSFTTKTGEGCRLQVEHNYLVSIAAMEPFDLAHRVYSGSAQIRLRSGAKDSTLIINVGQTFQ